MHELFVTPLLGLIITSILVGAFGLVGALISYFLITRISANEKAFSFFSSILMIVLALYTLGLHAVKISVTYISLFQLFTGFFIGLIVGFSAMAIHDWLAKGKHHTSHVGMILFVMLMVHEIAEGALTAEVFFEMGNTVPLFASIMSLGLLALHELPEGIMLSLPFFVSMRRNQGWFVIFTNLFVYIGSVLIFFVFFRISFDPGPYEEAVMTTIPAGGIFAIGVYEGIKILRAKLPASSNRAIISVWVVGIFVLASSIYSLYHTRSHALERMHGEIPVTYELDPETGERVPTRSADPCSRQINFTECLD